MIRDDSVMVAARQFLDKPCSVVAYPCLCLSQCRLPSNRLLYCTVCLYALPTHDFLTCAILVRMVCLTKCSSEHASHFDGWHQVMLHFKVTLLGTLEQGSSYQDCRTAADYIAQNAVAGGARDSCPAGRQSD